MCGIPNGTQCYIGSEKQSVCRKVEKCSLLVIVEKSNNRVQLAAFVARLLADKEVGKAGLRGEYTPCAPVFPLS